MSPFMNLIDAIFNFYIMVIIVRFLLQLFRADFYNPLSQFVVRVTNPVLKPLRRVIPGFGGIDVSSIIFAFVVCLIKIVLIYNTPSISYLILLSFRELIVTTIYLFIGMIIIRAIVSWVSPGIQNPIMAVVYQLSEPVMAPVRRLIPPIGGLDLSPIILLLGLQFAISAIDLWVIRPLLQIM